MISGIGPPEPGAMLLVALATGVAGTVAIVVILRRARPRKDSRDNSAAEGSSGVAGELARRLTQSEQIMTSRAGPGEIMAALENLRDEVGRLTEEVRLLRSHLALLREDLAGRLEEASNRAEWLQASLNQYFTSLKEYLTERLDETLRRTGALNAEIARLPSYEAFARLIATEAPRSAQGPVGTDLSAQQVIAAHFDEIDRRTDRDFERLKKEFERLLGARVTRIEEIDNAVLFYLPDGTVILRPWKNARLRSTWLPYFDLDRGPNLPIAKVRRAAILKPLGDGGWEVIQRGSAENEY